MTGIIAWILRGWLSRWALTAEGEIKNGWRWLTASPVHALLGIITVLALVLLFAWHQTDKYRSTIARMTVEANGWRVAHETDAATITDLQTEIARQNLAVMQLGKDSAARIAAGARADDAALERSTRRAKLSDAITVPAPRAPVAGCQTDPAVMAAKSEL